MSIQFSNSFAEFKKGQPVYCRPMVQNVSKSPTTISTSPTTIATSPTTIATSPTTILTLTKKNLKPVVKEPNNSKDEIKKRTPGPRPDVHQNLLNKPPPPGLSNKPPPPGLSNKPPPSLSNKPPPPSLSNKPPPPYLSNKPPPPSLSNKPPPPCLSNKPQMITYQTPVNFSLSVDNIHKPKAIYPISNVDYLNFIIWRFNN
jgi:hypothetical protein